MGWPKGRPRSLPRPPQVEHIDNIQDIVQSPLLPEVRLVLAVIFRAVEAARQGDVRARAWLLRVAPYWLALALDVDVSAMRRRIGRMLEAHDGGVLRQGLEPVQRE